MQTPYWKIAKLTWLCVLVLMMGAGGAIGAESIPPQDEILGLESASAMMDSEFSYQGVLKNNGTPVNGIRNFRFQLHTDAACTNELEEVVKSSVPVVEGRFSVSLMFRHTHFNGQKLWLQLIMGASTRLMCEEILAVPYALSVMPGAEIKNTMSEVTLNNFEGLVGKTTAVGVDGSASGGNLNYGIRGSIESGAGAGVYAVAESATSNALFARNNNGGTAGAFYGNVTQNTDGYGLVKAGVFVLCGDPSGTERQFGPSTITNDRIGTGFCELDFGFDVSNRFWQATIPEATVPGFVSCMIKSADNNVLQCVRWTQAGTQINGHIMVLIY